MPVVVTTGAPPSRPPYGTPRAERAIPHQEGSNLSVSEDRYAFAYGGLIQLLAGMWEFRNRNVFGATAFSTYGGFWIGVGIWYQLVAVPAITGAKTPVALAVAVRAINHDQGWILLAFAIFNTYMLI